MPHENDTVCVQEEPEDTNKRHITPLPKMQLAMVILSQSAEPITATLIYPFINKLIREIGITHGDDRITGYYAGMIESLFFFSQLLTVVFWARAADHYGRKPVLVIGLLGLSVSMLAFGMSTKFWMLLVSRFCQGGFNGIMSVVKTVLADITDSTNRAEAFKFVPSIWVFGSAIAPTIGGLLADPAIQYPDTLGKIQLLRRFPYLLPCMVASVFTAFIAVLLILFLKETAPAVLKSRGSNASGSETPLLEESNTTTDYGTVRQDTTHESAPSIRLLLRVAPDAVKIMLTLGFLPLVEGSFMAIFPLVYSTPIKTGGLGFPPHTIGLILGSIGLCDGFFQFLLFARIQRWLGGRKMYIVCFSSLAVPIGAYPFMIHMAQRAGRADGFVWTGVIVQGICIVISTMAYGCTYMLTVEIAPTAELVGIANGLNTMVFSGMRIIGLFAASSLFSISLERNLMGGRLVYWVLLALVALGVRASFMFLKDNRR